MRLGNRLLEIMNESDIESTNWVIASTILSLGQKIKFISIKDLSEKCHVSEATISRFVRKLGYGNFGILKQHGHTITETNMTQMFHMSSELLNLIDSDPNTYLKNYCSMISISLNDIMDSINHNQIESLLNAIHTCKRIFIFSCSTSLMLSYVVQSTLVNYGKIVVVGANEKQQYSLINHINADDLVITISVFGNYIHDNLEIVQKLTKLSSLKVLITQNPGVQETYYFDEIVCFSKKNHNETGFYSMLFGIEFLMRKYALTYRN